MSTKSKKRKRKKPSLSSSEEEDEKASKKDVTRKHNSSERRQHVGSHDRKMSEKSKERRSKRLSSSSSEEEDERASKEDVTKKYKSSEKRQHASRHDRKKSEKSQRRSSKKSSSSEEEDERASKDVTKKGKSAEKRQHGSSHESRFTTKPEKEGTCASLSIKDVSQSSRPIKQAVYRLDKRETDQTPVSKPVECTTLKSVCVPKEKPDVSEKYTVVRVCKPVVIGPSLSIRKTLEKRKHLEEQKRDLKAKESQCTEAKTSSSTNTERPSTTLDRSSGSNALKQSTSKPGNVASVPHTPAPSSHTPKQRLHLTTTLPVKFTIPKRAQLQPLGCFGNRGISTNRNRTRETVEPPVSAVSGSNAKQKTARPVQSHAGSTPRFQLEGQEKKPSLLGQHPTLCSASTAHRDDQRQVVEEIMLARSEKTLEVNVMQSYGELTSMIIDPPEEGSASTQCKQPLLQQDLILILDTNILLSHLDYVKKIQSHGLGALGFPVLLIPWVVLQELDYLKMGKSLSGSVAHLASPAISYIYNCLTRQEPRLWGQSMQQAAHSNNGLNAENNDDRVLQCCLQYQGLYPECALILCTNDKNLCSKALLSGVKALSKSDLEMESGRTNNGLRSSQSIQTPMLLHSNSQVPAPIMSESCTPAQHQNTQEVTRLSVGPIQNDDKWPSKGANEEEKERRRELSTCVSELEVCLREALSDVLEVEMKAAFDELWLEIVYIKPPWTLGDVLQCFKKHWIAVFGFIALRQNQQIIVNLIDFFNSAKTVEFCTTLDAVREAKEFLKVFEKRSRRVPSSLSTLDNILHRLQHKPAPQPPALEESPACDVVMNDDEEEQDMSTQVSHREVWVLFENMWSNMTEVRLAVFKALCFDPQTPQSAEPVGGPAPPQDALACLHKLSSVVSQLLQAFSSILSSTAGLPEVQALLSFIHSCEIVSVDPRLTAQDLLHCFSQEEYREKLRVGGNQLMEVKASLDCCAQAVGQRIYCTYS